MATLAELLHKASDALKKQADSWEDPCEIAQGYLAAGEALLGAAAAETDPVARITDLKNAAKLFETAAEFYKRCGDDAIDDDPLHAREAFHREIGAHRMAESCEGQIEEYYTPREPVETGGIFGPATQHGKAAKRKQEDAEKRKKAEGREEEAQKKYLE